MTALELLADLRRRGVMLRAEGDRLCGDAPKGILTPKDRAALAEHPELARAFGFDERGGA